MFDITAVHHIREYVVWLKFEDGTEGEVDLRQSLRGPVFEPLRDLEYFKQVRVDPETRHDCMAQRGRHRSRNTLRSRPRGCLSSFRADHFLLPTGEKVARVSAPDEGRTSVRPFSSAMINPLNTDMTEAARHLSRIVLTTFVVSFIVARMVVYLIMDHRVPNMFLHMGGTHVHHLNYGIFILSAVGAYLLFANPLEGRRAERAAVVYAFGLALTFDEFGMWLHLGGPYWHRASVDAVVVIAAILALVAFAPQLQALKTVHYVVALFLTVCVAVFFYWWGESFGDVATRAGEHLRRLEERSPQ